jgi:hypothetical protein
LILGWQDEKFRQFNINKQEWNVSIQAMEVITNDPSTLSDEYLSDVQRRLIGGNATDRDRLYEAELRRRGNLYGINDKHNPAKPSGGPDASILPTNHLELWESRAYYDEKQDAWWSMEGKGKKAVFHRFSNDGNGAFHWSGSTGKNENRKGYPVKPIPLNTVPVNEIKKATGK